jgi:outer membrane protein assembly factor BamB
LLSLLSLRYFSGENKEEKRMNILNKKNVAVLALFLLLGMFFSLFVLPNVNAATYVTYPFISVQPDPVGVGQTASVVVWVDKTSGGTPSNTIRFQNYSIVVERPDKQTERLMWNPDVNEAYIVWDTTSSAYTTYTPDIVGTYTLTYYFPEQSIGNNNWLASNTSTTLTVQEEQLPEPINSYPLPTEYWTRPIEDQNSWWYQISSNWYNSVRDRNYGGILNSRFQPDGVATTSPHVMWSAPISDEVSSILGFSRTNIPFATQIIMNGLLYYPVPKGTDPAGGGWMIVDLRTGEPVVHYTGEDMPSFGYLYNADYYNQHGVLPSGMIFSEDYAVCVHAKDLDRSGWTFTTYNLPPGVEAIGGHGEHYRLGIEDLTPIVGPELVNSQFTESASQGSNHIAEVPSGVQANDTLLWFLSSDGEEEVTFPDPWIEIAQETGPGFASFPGFGTPTVAVAYTKALGNESGTTLMATTGTSERAVSNIWVVRNAADPDETPPYISASAEGNNANPDPAALTAPGGLGPYDAYMWIAVAGNDDDDIAVAWPLPENQEAYESETGNGGSSLALCSLTSNVATQDPTAFTIEAGEQWVAYTLAIAPQPREVQPTPDYQVYLWNSTNMLSFGGSVSPSSSNQNLASSNYFDFRGSVINRVGTPITTLPPGAVNIGAMFNMEEYTYIPSSAVLVCRGGTLPTPFSAGSYNYLAVSLMNQTINGRDYIEGQLMWDEDDYNLPEGTIVEGPAAEGVFTMVVKETGQWMGFDMLTGAKLWTSDPETDYTPYGYTEPTSATGSPVSIADGKLFTTGYSGTVFCYDLYNGTLLWRYEAPVAFAADVSHYPLHIGVIADGKIYLGNSAPLDGPRVLSGGLIRCLSVEDGTEVWTMPGWGGSGGFAVSDGYLVYLNYYDFKLYVLGKGPSAATVAASPDVSVFGDTVALTGTVTDVSLGSAIRGSGAISDADMADWMAYKFMGAPKPEDAIGVEVIFTALDSNGNTYEVGRTACASDGTFSFDWKPEITGEYLVTATFAGSEGYYASLAQTTLFVEEAPLATPEPTPTPAPMTDTYVLGSTIAIIIALAAAGTIIVLLIIRRR